jgi:putative transposase
VATLCRVVGASVSGFYAWLRAIPAVQSRAEAEAELRGRIGRIFVARRRVYGSPRVHAELRREGLRHSRRHVERLMHEMGLSARRCVSAWKKDPIEGVIGVQSGPLC